MEIIVRKMDLSDIPFVYQEELRIFGKSLGEKALYNEIIYNDMSRYFIATSGGKRVGYVGTWLTIPNAEVINLFVIEPFRGQGIGLMLMKQVIEVCKEEDIQQLTLEVRTSNNVAIQLYTSLGFKTATIRKQYYENGEDALLMVLEVGEVT